MEPLQLILVSGMGGAGKTTALHTLEDLGFYCTDNLPLVLLPNFLTLLSSHEEIRKIAIGFDIRDSLFLPQAPGIIETMLEQGYRPEIVFLDATDQVLLRRYKETRRIHPLDKSANLPEAIKREREILKVLQPYIQTRIDTSELTPHQLRDLIKNRHDFAPHTMRISIVSFGYKYGVPMDADLVFDVRFLKNPFFVPELSKQTGLDKPVADYVFSDPDAQTFVDQTVTMLNFLIPRYKKEGKQYLTIGIGCTGGQHRSIALAQAIYQKMKDSDFDWQIHHRELSRYVNGG